MPAMKQDKGETLGKEGRPMDDHLRRALFNVDRALYGLDRKLNRILLLVRVSLNLEVNMSKEMDDIAREVGETNTVIDSAIVLINGIAARIEAAGVDRAKLAALTTELDEKANLLSAKVAENTEQPPPPPPPPA